MPSEDPQALPLLEALHSTPSRRHLSTDPVGDDVVRAILDAAVRGPAGGNSQRWAWNVVRDPEPGRMSHERRSTPRARTDVRGCGPHLPCIGTSTRS